MTQQKLEELLKNGWEYKGTSYGYQILGNGEKRILYDVKKQEIQLTYTIVPVPEQKCKG
jgi:hypothetical protein